MRSLAIDTSNAAAARLPVLVTAFRFGAVGVGGVAVNLVVLQLLYGALQLPLIAASALAVEIAIVHNYLLNDRWTFHARRGSMLRFARFNVAALATLLTNVLIVGLLVRTGVSYLVADMLGIGAGALLNLGASSVWVWRGGAP